VVLPHVPLADDLALLRALARGDRTALALLYDRHAPLLLTLGLRIVGDRTQAEDVLHDVFLEAWHHARAYDPTRGSVRAWLVTRMRSRALDRRATAARHARIAEEISRETEASSAAEAPLDNQRLHAEIATMAPELHAVIALAYFEGMSSPEIAQHLAIPIGTVKSRMARALALLRASLADAPAAQDPSPAPSPLPPRAPRGAP
jgi:RNA polymerase sigma-70 factor (ECF subfamily)